MDCRRKLSTRDNPHRPPIDSKLNTHTHQFKAATHSKYYNVVFFPFFIHLQGFLLCSCWKFFFHADPFFPGTFFLTKVTPTVFFFYTYFDNTPTKKKGKKAPVAENSWRIIANTSITDLICRIITHDEVSQKVVLL